MRSSSGINPPLSSALKAIDARFSKAGLVRSQRGQAGRALARSLALNAQTPEELTLPAPVPCRAANGVEWLPVPGWDFSWLWSGFSTRKGGLSRAYCAEDAPGELNLGFTAADDRETVLSNRRLLAEAVTGDAGTPLVTLRQFHSNLHRPCHRRRRGPQAARIKPTGK